MSEKLLQKNILSWFKKSSRALPWRQTSDPYKIWISEIMLQQTRVDTVIDYWYRFLDKFPNVETLADADEQEVLKIWQGLGYYRRAKLLHKASKQIVLEYSGKIPSTKKQLLTLSGFGPYTAGAVASIAFGEKVPCVDGNVIRVLSRAYASDDAIEDKAFLLAQCSDPSSLNQGLMELGALICLPKNPKCSNCPVEKYCVAHAEQKIDFFPKPRKKIKVKNINACALIIENPKTQSFIMRQRPSTGRWSNLWEFPYFEFMTKPKQIKKYLLDQFPHAQNIKKIGHVEHVLTHQKIEVEVYHATWKAPQNSPEVWTTNWKELPTSVLQKKIANITNLQ